MIFPSLGSKRGESCRGKTLKCIEIQKGHESKQGQKLRERGKKEKEQNWARECVDAGKEEEKEKAK